MEYFYTMTFEQAMKHIACHDVYLKWQEDPSASHDEWFDLDKSFNRAWHYQRAQNYYGTLEQSGWTKVQHQALGYRFDSEVFPSEYEFGTEAWFIQLGCILYAIKEGRGWLQSRYRTHNNMMRIFGMINDDDLIEGITEAIRDGNTSLHICDSCDEFCYDPTEVRNGDGYVCASCCDNYYVYCDYNDHWFPRDDSVDAIGPNGERWTIDNSCDTCDFTWDDYNERYVHDDYQDESRIIQGYHSHGDNFCYVVSPWTKSNKRFFGVELEVEATDGDREECAENIHNWFNNNRDANEQLFFEEDGSLSHGFEMISQPMGLDKHREIWKWVEQKHLIKGLRSHNTNTCGLHVHVSKAGLSSLTISKAVCFVNNPSNMSLIKAIARRYDSGYCRPKHVTLAKGHRNGDKYEMLNIGKRHTIEFRMFRGSLNYNAIQAALEFSNAVVNFALETSMEELNEVKFLEFIYKPEQRMDTKFLRDYLEQRSPRIKDIVDRAIKPLYKLRVVRPEPVEICEDEPKIVPPSRRRGGERDLVSYPIDVEPPNPNANTTNESTLSRIVRERLAREAERDRQTDAELTAMVDALSGNGSVTSRTLAWVDDTGTLQTRAA